MKKTPIRNRILIIISIIKRKYLPSQATLAVLSVPSRSLFVKDGLREGEPLRGFGGGVGEVHFCGGHGG